MKVGPVSLLLLGLAVGCGGKKEEAAPAGPRKLAKMDIRVSIDGKGRIRPAFSLFDQKMKPLGVEQGTYSIGVRRASGEELCKLDGTFAKTDFSDAGAYKADYKDASCPKDPESKDLKIAVTVVAGDKTIERTLELPAALVYLELPRPPVPTAGSGSGSGSAGSAGSGSTDSGSAGNGSAAGSGSGSGSALVEKPTAPTK